MQQAKHCNSVTRSTTSLNEAVGFAGAKTGWRLAWETMVRELAPQDSSGSYTRPANAFNERIGAPGFPVR
jgi:hypothetical protein